VGSAPKAHPPPAENPTLGRQMFYTYVLWSDKLKKRYIGCTKNLEERLSQHNKGKNRFTSGGIPWKLIYYEEFITLREARRRESFLKSGIGRNWLDKKLINV